MKYIDAIIDPWCMPNLTKQKKSYDTVCNLCHIRPEISEMQGLLQEDQTFLLFSDDYKKMALETYYIRPKDLICIFFEISLLRAS